MGLFPRLFGWAGNAIERPAYEQLRSNTDYVVDTSMIDWKHVSKQLQTPEDPKGKRFVFWDNVIKLTGKHLPNTAQQDGDCVAAGTEMALEYLLADEIVRLGEFDQYRPVFRPWLYGIGRVYVGKNRIRGAGSVLSWMMEGIKTYGVLAEDEPGVPKYSRSVSVSWGTQKRILDQFAPLAKQQVVKNFVDIKNFDDLAKAVIIGKMIPVIASSQGMRDSLQHDAANNKSWFVPSGTWEHLMHIPGVDYSMQAPGLFVGNQWGTQAHPGQLDGPSGGGWIRAEFFDRWLRQKHAMCVAFNKFEAWPLPPPDLRMS